MAQVSACPDERQLQNIVQGQAGPDDLEAFAVHLEECQGCAQRLDRGLVGDTLLEAMQAPATVPEHPSDPAVQPLIERLLRQRPGDRTSADAPPDTTAEFSGVANAGPEADDLSFLASPQAPDEIGRLGTYRVLKVLGSGGMGVVFQAEDVHLKRRVALKVMKPEVARKPMAKARFLREAQAAAAIEHDHIVTIHQVGEDRGVPFLAMQWLKGLSLEDRLKQGGALKPAQIVRIGRQIALGLAAAHDQGLIHRDIKPANLWLTPEQGGRIKILDFGLARALADDAHITQSGVILGTPAYMAPEQARGDPVDHRCDLFSLGVVLYRLTTGRLPFRGNTTMAVLSSLATDQPEPPRLLVGDLPAELSDLIVQLLAKDPAQRPATAQAVADRLQAIDKLLGTRQVDPDGRTALLSRPDGSGEPSYPATAAPGPERREPDQATQALLRVPLARKVGRKRPLAIAVAVGALALLVAGAVFFLQTPNGTIRIEINDDSIEAILTKNGAVIKGADKAHDIHVAAGEQGLKIKRGDLEFETDKFVLKKGETITLKIELLPGKVQVVQGERVIGEKALMTDRTAAEWVLSLGGTVTIDDGAERLVSVAKDLPAGNLRLRKIELPNNTHVDDAGLKELAGLTSLQRLNLGGTQVTDAGLKELAGLKSLQWLALEGTKVTDAGLKQVAGLTSLQDLDLGGIKVTDAGLTELAGLKSLCTLGLTYTKVTDAGLKELAGIRSLQTLGLGHTQVTDVGLKELAGLKSLQTLDLRNTQVTDAGLKELAGLTSLQTLSLRSTLVTDAGLKELGGLKSLQKLDLRFTQVTDAGLKELGGLKGLRELYLLNTQVTDASLKELARLTSLQYVELRNTQVTAQGIAALHKALPGCHIDSDVMPASAAGNDRRAAEWVLALGGTVTIDDGAERAISAVNDLPAGPWTLRQIDLRDKKQVDVGLKELAGLKSLQVLDLGSTEVTSAGVKVLAALKSLQTLKLNHSKVTDTGLKELAGLQSLQELALHATPVTDAGLKELAGLQSLQTLGLDGTQVTGGGLKELAGLKSLQTLGLDGTQVTDVGLKELAGLKSLQTLSLRRTKVTDAGLRELGALKSLLGLNLGGTKVTDAGLKELAGLKNLQSLSLWATNVTDAGLVHLVGLAELKDLNLKQTPVTAQGIAALRKALPRGQITSDVTPAAAGSDRRAAEWVLLLGGKVIIDDGIERTVSAAKDLPAGPWAVREIALDDNKQVDNAGLKQLAGLNSLRTLSLMRTKVTGAGLAGLKSLQTLHLGGTQVTGAGLKELAGLKSLQSLQICDAQVTDAGLKELAALDNLLYLDLARTRVTDAGLQELAGLKSLRSLSLWQTGVTDAGLKELAGLKNLQRLNLDGTKVTAQGIAALQKTLPGCQITSDVTPATAGSDRRAADWVLSLGGTVTIDDGKQLAISAAKELPAGLWTLRQVELRFNYLVNDAGLKELASLQSLQTLSLRNTPVTDAGLKELTGLKSLKLLDLGNTKVTDAGLKELAGLQSLQTLHLWATPVTDAGLKDLVGLTSLQTLNLNGTKVTGAGLKHLVGLKSLQVLSLLGTKVTDAGLVHLQGLAELKTLDLTKTQVTAKGVAALQKALPGCEITSDVTPAAAGNDPRAAEWVLSLGGTVTIDDGKERAISAANELPAGPWKLRRIELISNKQIDDTGLKELASLKSLYTLGLGNTKVTDAGLKELGGIRSLQTLRLGGTKVTDAGLAELAGIPTLRTLDLGTTMVTGAGLKELAGRKTLRILILNNTPVNDAGLKELAGLHDLRSLWLNGTRVTDAGLVRLHGLAELKYLDLRFSPVTAQGIAALQKALPGCRIDSDVK